MNKHYIEPLWRKFGVFGLFINGFINALSIVFIIGFLLNWNIGFRPCLPQSYHYMAADG